MKRAAKYLDYKNQFKFDSDFDESILLGKSFKNNFTKAKFLV